MNKPCNFCYIKPTIDTEDYVDRLPVPVPSFLFLFTCPFDLAIEFVYLVPLIQVGETLQPNKHNQ